jgi:hypothetical protein
MGLERKVKIMFYRDFMMYAATVLGLVYRLYRALGVTAVLVVLGVVAAVAVRRSAAKRRAKRYAVLAPVFSAVSANATVLGTLADLADRAESDALGFVLPICTAAGQHAQYWLSRGFNLGKANIP